MSKEERAALEMWIYRAEEAIEHIKYLAERLG